MERRTRTRLRPPHRRRFAGGSFLHLGRHGRLAGGRSGLTTRGATPRFRLHPHLGTTGPGRPQSIECTSPGSPPRRRFFVTLLPPRQRRLLPAAGRNSSQHCPHPYRGGGRSESVSSAVESRLDGLGTGPSGMARLLEHDGSRRRTEVRLCPTPRRSALGRERRGIPHPEPPHFP